MTHETVNYFESAILADPKAFNPEIIRGEDMRPNESDASLVAFFVNPIDASNAWNHLTYVEHLCYYCTILPSGEMTNGSACMTREEFDTKEEIPFILVSLGKSDYDLAVLGALRKAQTILSDITPKHIYNELKRKFLELPPEARKELSEHFVTAESIAPGQNSLPCGPL